MLACLAGCAARATVRVGVAPRTASFALDESAIATWIAPAPDTGAETVVLAPERDIAPRAISPPRSFDTVRLGADRPRAAARSRRRVDVAFDHADLPNALRFLADAAGVNLVVADGVSGTVSARLARVDPLDALFALAQAHGADVRMEGRIAIVTVATAAAAE